MVGSRVGKLIAEAQLIYNWEAEAGDVASLIHPHPTQSEALGEAHLALAGKPLHVHGSPFPLSPPPPSAGRSTAPMPTSVTMPALGESVTEGTVTRWLKQEGEQVEVDEPLLEVSTDKVDTEIPSPAAGVLTKILVAEDETVEVGAELAVIGGDGGGGGAPAQESAPAQEDSAPGGAARGAGAGARSGPGGAARPRTQSPPRPRPTAGWAARGGGEGTPVTMPALGESVTEGTVTRWLKQEGEQVEVDEPLLEVSTDKVDTEIPSPAAGVLTKILVAEDETVEVGAQLAVIGGGGGGAAAPAKQEAAPAPGAGAGGAAPKAPSRSRRRPRRSSPRRSRSRLPRLLRPPPPAPPPAPPRGRWRRRERQLRHAPRPPAGQRQGRRPGVGFRHRRRRADPQAGRARRGRAVGRARCGGGGRRAPYPVAGRHADTSVRGRTEKLSRLRAVIARRMVESLQVPAQLTTVVEADVTRIASSASRRRRTSRPARASSSRSCRSSPRPPSRPSRRTRR